MNTALLAERIDGKGFAATLVNQLTDEVNDIKAATGLTPGLAVVLVGEDPASSVYVSAKHRQTLAIGMQSFVHRLPADTAQADLMTLLDALNAANEVNGILVQLPLPAHLDTHAVINAIDPDKDVDGFHILNAGRLATGQDALVPCTPLGCLMMLKDRLGNLEGLNAVVVGKSNIVGKPMAQLLMAENCTVSVAHSKSRDVPALCRSADILVVAAGCPELVKGDWIKPGAVVIDVGINRIERDGRSRIVGDVAFDEAGHAAAITPVPGGVGPMTIACLLANTVTAFKRQHHHVTTKAVVAV
ncbi:bifunctional methylenetetrahydrofolate dehydrogenase/methenyltetrahydrofolate cyclohydrolase FolD [Pseudomonas sp. LJDD11]|uniref:bifunctional methylenetetrahydrofolate dehydrogenase/methenyltetrahydrofolate cyclohydrolase FolD n=1 Tax=Pseudomonas sp. LJDD11 TaxID=2931984 RepID=UPI00211C882A|nr:bifunctional methylenetetrahydrofolate dehydrogenase/methenyltetrahydrofolate cyclohydrolase FolD [Pseudomonas sp. LJDD11]MCQ9422992.1 bifunctional methylenetetrahydrofolate dehydrogenase/methenyltetrahydrofolate cyclohydrolase FolD [Pseudomonas sp. LJDD11]